MSTRGIPFRAGHAKRGGRKKGVLNKRTLALKASLQRTRDLTADVVIEQIRRNALYDARRLFQANGHLKPLRQLSEADAAMIEGIEVVRRPATDGAKGTEEVIKLKIASRSPYVRMAGDVHGLFLQRQEVTGELSMAPVTVTVVHRHVTLEVLEAERIAQIAPENGDRAELGTGEVIEATVASAASLSPKSANS